MSTMQCDVVSVQESLYSGTVTMLIAKGAGGELGIMPGHAPLVTLLKPGTIRVLLENGTRVNLCIWWCFRSSTACCTVLADTAVRAENLDETAILEARKHAEQLLCKSKRLGLGCCFGCSCRNCCSVGNHPQNQKPRSIRDGLRLKSHRKVAFIMSVDKKGVNCLFHDEFVGFLVVIVQMDWIESAAYMQSLFCMIVLRLLTVRWLVEYFEYTILIIGRSMLDIFR